MNLKTPLNLFIFLLFILSIAGCDSKRGSNGITDGDDIKLTQYLIEGKRLYQINCANCHQQDGNGLGAVYPPLNNSDYLKQNFEASICLMKNGMQGELVVNGTTYNQMMPANPQLTNLEIAEISTYIYNTWGGRKGMINVKEVDKILSSCEQK